MGRRLRNRSLHIGRMASFSDRDHAVVSIPRTNSACGPMSSYFIFSTPFQKRMVICDFSFYCTRDKFWLLHDSVPSRMSSSSPISRACGYCSKNIEFTGFSPFDPFPLIPTLELQDSKLQGRLLVTALAVSLVGHTVELVPSLRSGTYSNGPH